MFSVHSRNPISVLKCSINSSRFLCDIARKHAPSHGAVSIIFWFANTLLLEFRVDDVVVKVVQQVRRHQEEPHRIPETPHLIRLANPLRSAKKAAPLPYSDHFVRPHASSQREAREIRAQMIRHPDTNLPGRVISVASVADVAQIPELMRRRV